MKSIKRIVQKAKTFKKAEEWDILQQIRMSPEERQAVSFTLRKRVYGSKSPDVREAYKSK